MRGFLLDLKLAKNLLKGAKGYTYIGSKVQSFLLRFVLIAQRRRVAKFFPLPILKLSAFARNSQSKNLKNLKFKLSQVSKKIKLCASAPLRDYYKAKLKLSYITYMVENFTKTSIFEGSK
ncbi:hypothetical protein KHA90_21340 [Flavobacterium psychroterrae]|jgi:hypothetical protein|uniref:Uncharacterized protein n=1 Tax=Flavobacterium psychroterrae TaxID=2133767 RepID=A0ABS5PH40_9FLAO|nr:hypothetical protein [Flavobacterium psychroterrae]MBS7233561.1 hypothetical protein [Flavobacterium psychroterrae]